MSREVRFQLQLTRQLEFLNRSAALFDLGHWDEAVRIATSLRVLFYKKAHPRSGEGSLLKHLGAENIQLVTTCKAVNCSEKIIHYDGYLNLPGNMTPWGEIVQDDAIQVSVDDWWSQTIFIVNHQVIRRKDLILAAANQDGGAHVDAEVEEDYAAVSNMWQLSANDESGKAITRPFAENHLFALRRFALEVLKSDQLMSLAKYGVPSMGMQRLLWVSHRDGPVINRAIDINHYRHVGDEKSQSGEHAEAFSNYKRALQLLDEIRQALLLGSGAALIKSEDYDTAISQYQTVLMNEPKNVRALYGAGFANKEIGNLEEAQSLLEAAISEDSKFAPAYQSLAALYAAREDYQKALELLDQAIELGHDDAKTIDSRSRLIEKLNASE